MYSYPMGQVIKGRGTAAQPAGRFQRLVVEPIADESPSTREGAVADDPDLDRPLPRILTQVQPELARSIITRNTSPDLPFDQSINPYRGCEHGCIYCFARPSHAYVGLSPGLDFETRLFYKRDAARLLTAELTKPGYRCKPIMLGTNTDPYQPIEREHGVTRSVLQVLWRCRHPVAILTKGAWLERDLELISSMAKAGLARVTLSLPTLDVSLKRILEPRAASPQARLRLLRQLSAAGIPAGVLVAPIIPAITDHELEALLEAASAAGAERAGYVFLRLPHEVAELFQDWLTQHFPDRAARVMALVREARGGADNDSRFLSRLSGQGQWVTVLKQRFALACRRLKLANGREIALDCSQFQPQALSGPNGQRQLRLDL